MPGKVLKTLAGIPLLDWCRRRMGMSTAADGVVIASSSSPTDDLLFKYCQERKWLCIRGSEDDVLSRFIQAAKACNAEALVRITSDCPFADPELVDQLISKFKTSGADYMGNVSFRTFPRGLDAEIVSLAALLKTKELAKEKRHFEHATTFIYENPEVFDVRNFLASPEYKYPELRFCVDDEEDLARLETLVQALPSPAPESCSVLEIIKQAQCRPSMLQAMHEAEDRHKKKNEREGIVQRFK